MIVQVIHAAMRTVRPDGFILRLLGHEFAVFIHANTGTFHNAAAVTAMSGIAAATFLDFHHRLGTNLIRAFKTADREIFVGNPPASFRILTRTLVPYVGSPVPHTDVTKAPVRRPGSPL